MNNQEAADELQYAIDLIKQDGKDWLDERDIPVLEMAISALQAQDSPKPKAESVQNVKDDDLILRKAAIDALGEEPEVWTGNDEYAQGLNNQWRYDVNALKALLPTQPEIVHCRDCMYYGTYYRGNESKPVITHLCKLCLDRTMEPDDYCSRAERRTDVRA